MERDGLIVFDCRREPAIAADVCLHTMVVLGLQLPFKQSVRALCTDESTARFKSRTSGSACRRA